jgi:hypothetical protein
MAFIPAASVSCVGCLIFSWRFDSEHYELNFEQSTGPLLLELARTGLKTIVVMAGGCALQTSPHIDQLHHETTNTPFRVPLE